MKRLVVIVLGGLIALFGLACLNYTSAWGVEHHAEWSAERGLPAPAPWMFDVGLAATPIGAAIAGFALGRRRT